MNRGGMNGRGGAPFNPSRQPDNNRGGGLGVSRDNNRHCHTARFVGEALSYEQTGPVNYGVGRGRPIDMSGPQLLANPPSFENQPNFDADPESDFSNIETTSELTPSLESNQEDETAREFDIEYCPSDGDLNSPDSSLASDVEESDHPPPSSLPSLTPISPSKASSHLQPSRSWSQILKTVPPIDAPLPMTVLPNCCHAKFVHNGDFNRLIEITQLELTPTKRVGPQESFNCLFFFCDHERQLIHNQNMQKDVSLPPFRQELADFKNYNDMTRVLQAAKLSFNLALRTLIVTLNYNPILELPLMMNYYQVKQTI